MSDWLDLELAHELRPVKAPEELWRRVQTGRQPRAAQNRSRTSRLPVLVAIAVLLAAGALWTGRRSVSLETLAARELGSSAHLELRSSDAVEIGAWLRREAGLDVAIPVSARVRLTGARVIRERGTPVGEVAYRVGNDAALLLVAREGGSFRASLKHGGLSWRMQQQVYALACATSGEPRAACSLCHANL